MNVLVLGAGTVGTSIAQMLCENRHDVTVVDQDPELVRAIDSRLDVRALRGSASEAGVLFQSGAFTADLCLAVTGVDEVNLVAASLAKSMGSHRAIARVYAPLLLDTSTFDYTRHFGIDRLLSLEHLSALELARRIHLPGVIPLESFARGQVEMQAFVLDQKTAATGVPLAELGLPRGVRVGSIYREGKQRIAQAGDVLTEGDQITLLGTREDIDEVRELFQPRPGAKLGVAIAGGGETGYHLARLLEGRRFSVLVMESDRDRCEFLSTHLKQATVVHCDATRRANLEEERVGSADVFVACTGDDEDNIMCGVEARELGSQTIMAIVSRPDYANIVGKLGIDHAVSPRRVMARQIMGFLTTGPVVSRADVGDGSINALEVEVLPDAPATQHVLAKLDLPSNCIIAAVMREDYVRVPGADDHLQAGDTVVVLVENTAVDETLRLFEVRPRR